MNNGARTITLGGKPQTLMGNELRIGQKAPEFEAVDLNMQSFRFSGNNSRLTLISSVSSLDTSVCDVETRRFNTEASHLGDQIDILTISVDLPFAQKRWCGAAGVDKVIVISDYKDHSFGLSYGVLIQESKLLARAIFIVDKKGIIQYIQLVPEIGQEPDYNDVLDAVRKLA
jgi:thiol peroxidase